MIKNSVGRVGVLSARRSPLLGYTLEALIGKGIDVAAVIVDSKGESDKDLAIWEERTEGRLPPISLSKPKNMGIPFYEVENHCGRDSVALVKKLEFDLLVNGGTLRILTSEILAAPAYGVLNVHPGLLPAYRGCTCVEWAIFNNDQVGNTVHYMTAEIDEGPIVMQEGYTFLTTDLYADVRTKVFVNGFGLLSEAVAHVLENDLSLDRLSNQGPGKYYKPIDSCTLAFVKQRLAYGQYTYQQKEIKE